VPLSELTPAAAPRDRSPKKFGASGVATSREDSDTKCDVRGERADDALRRIELCLDDAVLSGHSQITIVHGHGTGALKQVIREALSASPYVASFRAGEATEGGDGATIVTLRS